MRKIVRKGRRDYLSVLQAPGYGLRAVKKPLCNKPSTSSTATGRPTMPASSIRPCTTAATCPISSDGTPASRRRVGKPSWPTNRRDPVGAGQRPPPSGAGVERHAARGGDGREPLRRQAGHEPHRVRQRDARRNAVRDVPPRADLVPERVRQPEARVGHAVDRHPCRQLALRPMVQHVRRIRRHRRRAGARAGVTAPARRWHRSSDGGGSSTATRPRDRARARRWPPTARPACRG